MFLVDVLGGRREQISAAVYRRFRSELTALTRTVARTNGRLFREPQNRRCAQRPCATHYIYEIEIYRVYMRVHSKP